MNEKGRNPVLPPEICIADGKPMYSETGCMCTEAGI